MRNLILIAFFSLFFCTNAFAQQPSLGITLGRPCDVMRTVMDWLTGGQVDLAAVQYRMKNFPPNVTMSPPDAVDTVMGLTDAPNLTFFCRNDKDDDSKAVIYFLYGDDPNNMTRTKDITVVITRPTYQLKQQ